MPTPTFRMDEDGVHFWWEHDCLTYDRPPIPEREETMLPIHAVTGWQVQQTEPLTVTPSILCGRCGTHGFITNGAWVGV